MPFPSTPSPLRLKLIALFSGCAVGQTISYAEMAKLANGRDLRPKYQHLILAAIREANRTNGAVFGNVRGTGYQRLQNNEIAAVGANTRRKTAKAHRRSRTVMQNGLRNVNDRTSQLAITTEVNAAELLAKLASNRSIAKLPLAGTPPQSVGDALKATLEALRKPGHRKGHQP
jgi:hypothetical protein